MSTSWYPGTAAALDGRGDLNPGRALTVSTESMRGLLLWCMGFAGAFAALLIRP